MAVDVDERESLFDVLLMQSLFNPGVDGLPQVEQLFSQVPLPEDFETNAETEAPGLSDQTFTRDNDKITVERSGQRLLTQPYTFTCGSLWCIHHNELS